MLAFERPASPARPVSVVALLVGAFGSLSGLAAQGVRMPPGPEADAIARVRAETEPARDAWTPWPDWSADGPGGWSTPEPWVRWSALVREEALAQASDPERRAQLALCARVQGRDVDAWSYLTACAERPDLVAALLPAFLPGVAPGTEGVRVEAGGRVSGLADGVRLAPALPPELGPEAQAALGFEPPKLTLESFEVGGATLSMTVELDPDGCEIQLRHLAGPPVSVRVRPPVPRRLAIEKLYGDWSKLDDPNATVSVRLSAEDPEHELWAVFAPCASHWPIDLPPGAEPRLGRAGLRVDADGDARTRAFAAGLAALFDIPCPVDDEDPLGPDALEPLVLRLAPGPERDAKLTSLITSAEAYALRRPSPLARAAGAR